MKYKYQTVYHFHSSEFLEPWYQQWTNKQMNKSIFWWIDHCNPFILRWWTKVLKKLESTFFCWVFVIVHGKNCLRIHSSCVLDIWKYSLNVPRFALCFCRIKPHAMIMNVSPSSCEIVHLVLPYFFTSIFCNP